jgi:RHS repeat-associated protein
MLSLCGIKRFVFAPWVLFALLWLALLPTFASLCPQHEILTRLSARNITTTYAHDNAGLFTVATYSDATPSLSIVPGRLGAFGRPEGVTDALGARTFDYDNEGTLLSESLPGALADWSLKPRQDALGRPAGFDLLKSTVPMHSSTVEFKPGGSQIEKITSGGFEAAYEYLPGLALPHKLKRGPGAGTPVINTQWDYDFEDKLQSLTQSRQVDTTTLAAVTYQFDSRGRRDIALREDNTRWDYGYNDRNEVTSTTRTLNDGTPLAGYGFGYDFDDIGNRLTSNRTSRTTDYQPNNLNQITERDLPGVIDVLGKADAADIATVNFEPTTRQEGWFHQELSINNTTGAVAGEARVIVVKPNFGPNGEDGVLDETREFVLGPAAEIRTHDDDGNLTSDGLWSYAWDAENRLTSIESSAALPAAKRKRLEFVYDYAGRRVQKIVKQWSTTTQTYVETNRVSFIYQGWNLIAEIDAAGNLRRTHTWGTDLSGSEQGAGGVGGLLFSKDFITNQTTAPLYDGNGNVLGMVDLATGQAVSRYEYGPFGEPLRSDPNDKNPFRFSTKYTDIETGLSYYGYRFYNPATGSWLSRDPIGESGGINLYGFVGNDPFGFVDRNGLEPVSVATAGTATKILATPAEVAAALAALNTPTTLGLVVAGGGGLIIGGGTGYLVGQISTGSDENFNYTFSDAVAGNGPLADTLGGSFYEGPNYWAQGGPLASGGSSLSSKPSKLFRPEGLSPEEQKCWDNYDSCFDSNPIAALNNLNDCLNRPGNKGFVIGEGMDEIKYVARELQAQGIDAKWYQAWEKNFPDQRPMTKAELEAALARNARVFKSKIRDGYDIYDIGIDPTRSVRSLFYSLEKDILREKSYPSIPLTPSE